MRNEKISRVNHADPSGLVETKPENPGSEHNPSNRNGEISPIPLRSSQIRDRNSPDPEVSEKPEPRRFTAAYRARIVREAAACTEKGQIGALLRREGLYSSQLCEWRKKYQRGALTALKDNQRGRKQTNPLQKENEKLQQQVARLKHRLQQAETIIEVQKKISTILGIPPKSLEKDGDD